MESFLCEDKADRLNKDDSGVNKLEKCKIVVATDDREGSCKQSSSLGNQPENRNTGQGHRIKTPEIYPEIQIISWLRRKNSYGATLYTTKRWMCIDVRTC